MIPTEMLIIFVNSVFLRHHVSEAIMDSELSHIVSLWQQSYPNLFICITRIYSKREYLDALLEGLRAL